MKIKVEVPDFVIPRLVACVSVAELLRPALAALRQVEDDFGLSGKLEQVAASLDLLHKVVVKELNRKGTK